MDRRFAKKAFTARFAPLPLAISLAAAGVVSGFFSPEVLAACSAPSGIPLTITCTGSTLGNQFSAVSNLRYVVGLNATVAPTLLLGNVIELTGTGITFVNNGTVDPGLLSGVGLSSGVRIGNAAGSTLNFTNESTGTIKGNSLALPLAGINLTSLAGNAVILENGAGGTTTLTNNGIIGSTPLVALLPAEDVPVIALRGGAKNIVTNGPTGLITGRVALQASSSGNEFYNVGSISGSVNLGAGGASNKFYAIAGGQVVPMAGVSVELPTIVSIGLLYSAAGIVDGGTLNNGTGGGNTLYLQNTTSGPGTGTGGLSNINGSSYINFNNLIVNSGTWGLSNQLFRAGTTSPTVQLNGGLLRVDSAALTGASITANGGGLSSPLGGSSSVANNITIATNGLVVTNNGSLTLNGVLSGTGNVTKTSTGTLILNNANNYGSLTTLTGGTLELGNDLALGTSSLNVNGASTLSAALDRSVANAISLGANLTVNNTANLNLSGVISGTRALTKNGPGALTLSGANNFGGGLVINTGKVILNTAGAAGSGTITSGVIGTGALDTLAPTTLTNLVQLNGNLTRPAAAT